MTCVSRTSAVQHLTKQYYTITNAILHIIYLFLIDIIRVQRLIIYVDWARVALRVWAHNIATAYKCSCVDIGTYILSIEKTNTDLCTVFV